MGKNNQASGCHTCRGGPFYLPKFGELASATNTTSEPHPLEVAYLIDSGRVPRSIIEPPSISPRKDYDVGTILSSREPPRMMTRNA
jgi:hypothetical protein